MRESVTWSSGTCSGALLALVMFAFCLFWLCPDVSPAFLYPQGIVPHFITCNAFIGRSYAQVLSGFLRDCMRGGNGMELDRTEPLYIIELGTGSGKFSFFMLKALLEMKVRNSRGAVVDAL